MYEAQTFDAILTRMLERIPENYDKQEGSVIYDALAPAAAELHTMYIALDEAVTNSYGDTASRDYLIRLCMERGIMPTEATSAVVQLEVTPSRADLLGMQFRQPNSTVTYTVSEMMNSGIYRMKCDTAEDIGNRYLGAVLPVSSLDNLETAEITAILIPGTEEEETEHLRERYLQNTRIKPFAGNRSSYVELISGMPGVGAVKVTPFWRGAGTVLITLTDASYGTASDAFVQQIQEVVCPIGDTSGLGLAPIGHNVTIQSVKAKEITVQLSIAVASGYTTNAISMEIEKTINLYFMELRKAWAKETATIVRTAQITSRVMAIRGVIDVYSVQMNQSSRNITLDSSTIPILGGVLLV